MGNIAGDKIRADKKERLYAAIDLKSFYASVECVERGLDPLTTNLVVADRERTEKTICLAVSPSLKAHGISGRARLFEVVQQVRAVNALRLRRAGGRGFAGRSYDAEELEKNPQLELTYITAPPRMALYIEYSARIYDIYLKFAAPEDIHVYSIDEVFIDVTDYLRAAGLNAHDYTRAMIRAVLRETGITATAGIGTNLYLAKVAMDIQAKKMKADSDGVRIAQLDEISYRRTLWSHRPITDFWRVGRGYAGRLESVRLYTMGDIARCSLGGEKDYYNENLLYKLFGVNAELLVDHAWGYEPCTMKDIKEYRPETNCMSSGQVLKEPYAFAKARLVLKEMIDSMALELVIRKQVADQIVLHVGYDISNMGSEDGTGKVREYSGPVKTDGYGRVLPKPAHGTVSLKKHTSSAKAMRKAAVSLFESIVDGKLLVRRISVTLNHVISEEGISCREEQLDFFTDYEKQDAEEKERERERSVQQAMIAIRNKYGKNAVLKGNSLEKGATAMERNGQIGGHRA